MWSMRRRWDKGGSALRNIHEGLHGHGFMARIINWHMRYIPYAFDLGWKYSCCSEHADTEVLLLQ
jgi:hypothetical protein